ncbi:SDR family oxidoreductase [Rapidithrix thailandica]|uniref:SDR family oxidoreductase n=1 Tax=Rapidithrix thailandica TaxID=413964 RepID=A0AAW9S0X3_9BACT
MEKKNTISLLGCGWLGLPLATALVKEGYDVKGSTRHTEKFALLEKEGVKPYRIDLDDEEERLDWGDFLDTGILLINIPPGVKRNPSESAYAQKMEKVKSALLVRGLRQVIFVSATSVYANTNAEVDETGPLEQSPRAKALWKAEEVFVKDPRFQCTVLRLSGLLGYDRVPGKYFAGKQNLTTGSIPVNYIHQDDAVLLLKTLVEQPHWGTVFNGVAPLHPVRKDVYEANAKELEFTPPTFAEPEEIPAFKVIRGRKAEELLHFTFKYPDPMKFYYEKSE